MQKAQEKEIVDMILAKEKAHKYGKFVDPEGVFDVKRDRRHRKDVDLTDDGDA